MKKVSLQQAYFLRDLAALKCLVTEQTLIDAIDAHWRGDLQRSRSKYAVLNNENLTPEMADFARVDAFWVNVKIGDVDRATFDTEARRKCEHSTIALLFNYAAYSWAFWTDHSIAWRYLVRLFWSALRIASRDAVTMCIFLIGHMLEIRGWRSLGRGIAGYAHRAALSRSPAGGKRPFFFFDIIVAAYPYTCLMSGSSYVKTERSIVEGENYSQPDPYYRIIFAVSALYAAAYNGDINRSESYSLILKEESTYGGNSRYSGMAEIVALIPYALRGYSHLVREKVSKISAPVMDRMEPLVLAQACRLLALMALHDNRWSDATEHVARARAAAARLGTMDLWMQVDNRLEKVALAKAPFAVSDLSPFTAGLVPDRAVDTLGGLLADLLLVLGRAGSFSDRWFVKEVSTAIADHIGCQRIFHGNDSLPAGLSHAMPKIQIRGTWVTFSVSAESLYQARRSIATLSPMIATLDRCREEQATVQQTAQETALSNLAHQVSHDIQSPLAALKVITENAAELKDNNRVLLGLAYQRIKHIAGDLTRNSTSHILQKSQVELVCIEALIDQAVREKGLEFSARDDISISYELPKGQCHFVAIEPGELSRIISNLINNAVEAVSGRHLSVILSVISSDQCCVVSVRDSGKGIPNAVLQKLCARGATFGKVGGNGLGLHHAKVTIEEAGGTLTIESKVGEGTCVSLSLPTLEAPSWHCAQIQLSPRAPVVVLDDDALVHSQWRRRLADMSPSVELRHVFRTEEELAQWLDSDAEAGKAQLLLDYQLGNRRLNLNALNRRGVAHNAIVVTNNFMDRSLQSACKASGARLLPKPLVGSVTISLGHGSLS